MKQPLLTVVTSAVALMIGLPILAVAQPGVETAVPAPENSGPRIQFDNLVFDFGKVTGGESVKHTFIFTNTGDASLELTSVHPACGCTTAGDWTKVVEPGQTGTIPIQFNSGSFGGPIYKTVTINCNDKTQPTVTLQIRGTIWKPIDITPQYAVLSFNSETVSNATSTVRIVNNMETPIEVHSLECNNRNFSAELKTNKVGKEFEITVRTVPPVDMRNTQGAITLKTSATNAPTLSLIAMAIMQPALITIPDRVTVPSGALAEKWTSTVTIRNQLSTPLRLTEPAVNNQSIEYSVKEVEPGRVYNVEFAFPAGFEMAPGGSADFTIKSSHAEVPVLRIPILPAPAHAAGGAPTGVAIAPRAAAVLPKAAK